MPAQHFHLGPRYLGSRPAPTMRLDRHAPILHLPLSLVYICPHCGSDWFRAEVTGSRWSPVVAACAAHPDVPESTAPGSILLPWRQELDGQLPIAVLTYEFTTLLNAHDRIPTNVL